MTKTLGAAPPTSKRAQQSLDSDLPHVIDVDVDGVHAFEESEDSADDSMQHSIETHPKRSFLRPAVGGPKQEDNLADLDPDKNFLPPSAFADAAADLEHECSKLYSNPRELVATEIAALTECTDSAEAKEEHEECSSEDSDSEDNAPHSPQSLTGSWIWKRPSVWPSCTWQQKSELLQVVIAREDRGTRSYHFHAILG